MLWLSAFINSKYVNYTELLSSRFESEYVAKGYYFKKGDIRVTISRIHRVSLMWYSMLIDPFRKHLALATEPRFRD